MKTFSDSPGRTLRNLLLTALLSAFVLGCAGDESWDTEAWSSDAPAASAPAGDRTPRAIWECLDEMEPDQPVISAPDDLCGKEFGGGGGGGGGGGDPCSCYQLAGYCNEGCDAVYTDGDAYWCHVDCENQLVSCIGTCN